MDMPPSNSSNTMAKGQIDRVAYILGMITAFAECVTNECKKIAFSPPFYPEDYDNIKEEAEVIAADLGVYLWLEPNKDLSNETPLQWLVIFKFDEVLQEYRQLRSKKLNPALHFDAYHELLSYGTVWGDGAAAVTPQMRETRPLRDAFARILLNPGDWPPQPASAKG